MRKKQLALLCGFSNYSSLKRHIRNNISLYTFLNRDPHNSIFGMNSRSHFVRKREYKILIEHFEHHQYELELTGKMLKK